MQKANNVAAHKKVPLAPSLPGGLRYAFPKKKKVRKPPTIFGVWCFRIARYTAAAARVSMDTTKTFPASICRGEPLRKDIAAVPDSNPRVPAQICTTSMGE